LYVANEGRLVAFLPERNVEDALRILHAHAVAEHAAVVGRVSEGAGHGRVTLRSRIGGTRLIDMLSGEQLPRIC
jgi:hydrogenase expression/formation protein HypE